MTSIKGDKLVTLELYWQGDYTYRQKWDIDLVDILGTDKDIEAWIKKEKPSTDEQRLHFLIKNKHKADMFGNYSLEQSFSRKMSERTASSVSVPVSSLKAVKVQARIFQTYQSPSGLRARRDDLPVFFATVPEFEPDQTYQIKIVSKEDKLTGTYVKLVSEVQNKKTEEEKKVQSETKESKETEQKEVNEKAYREQSRINRDLDKDWDKRWNSTVKKLKNQNEETNLFAELISFSRLKLEESASEQIDKKLEESRTYLTQYNENEKMVKLALSKYEQACESRNAVAIKSSYEELQRLREISLQLYQQVQECGSVEHDMYQALLLERNIIENTKG